MSDALRPRTPRTPPISVSDRTTEVTRTGSWKHLIPEYHDRVAPCIEACPAGVDIEGYLSLLRDGRMDDACDLLLRENPMPAITGRVCDHPCETDCNRLRYDGAVSIHAVERVLGDRILAAPLPPLAERTHAERVAVIGSGPAGLSCAYHLARLGYGVHVFERDAEAGGMLRQGIPAYRLPRDVLRREVARLEALGVVIHRNAPVSTSAAWDALVSSHDAVFVGVGAQRGRRLGVPGEDLPGVRQGLEFLREVNSSGRGGRMRAMGPSVVVIGGGNTAMDCARTALRLGRADSVATVYRRSRDEMPAIPDEVAEAEREGARFVFLAAPTAIRKTRGRLTVVCAPMRLGEPDASGRRRPIPTGAAPLRIVADTVLLAIGEDVVLDGIPLRLGDDGALGVDDWGTAGAVGEAAVFSGGDVTGDVRTVARALGAGKRAAIGIDRHLRRRRGEPNERRGAGPLRIGEGGTLSMTRWRNDDPVARVAPRNSVVRFEELNLADFARAARVADRHADTAHITHTARRTGRRGGDAFAECNLGLAPEAALAEARRCLQCGVCNGCELCMIYCADVAIKRGSNGTRFTIDLDYCKGCGVCAAECPRGAITMTRDGSDT